MNDIGAVVVTYNSEEVIERCLVALRRWGIRSIIVVDNASADRTAEIVRAQAGVRLLANEVNRGFAGAVNQGMRALEERLICVLNPDVEPLGPLSALASACAEWNIAGACGRLVSEDDRPQTGFFVRRIPTATVLILEALGLNRLLPGNLWNRRYRCLDLDWSTPAWVEQPAGAFLLLRRDVFDQLGGFDESFHPLWFEDVDYCRRAQKAGYRFRYCPEVRARHRGGHSAGQLQYGERAGYWYGSLLRYSAKHFGVVGQGAVGLAVVTGAVARMAVGIIGWRSLKPAAAYGNVIRLSLTWLLGRRSS